MAIVLLGEIIEATRSASSLGISNRDEIIDMISRALDLGVWRENYNPSIGTLEMNSDACGWITLPYFVGTVLALNIGGQPALFRSPWFRFSQNGPGDVANGGNAWTSTGWLGAAGWGGGGQWNGQTWDDREWSVTFQDLTGRSALCAITENPLDGAGDLFLTVTGEVQSALGDPQIVTVQVPLLTNTATTDANATLFRRIISVVKPVTKGYVKLLGVKMEQGSIASVIGYYAPQETTPRYRRIRVSRSCQNVLVRYRIASLKLFGDHDILQISSKQAMLELIKSLRLSDTGNLEQAVAYEAHAKGILDAIQGVEEGPGTWQLQVDNSSMVGTIAIM